MNALEAYLERVPLLDNSILSNLSNMGIGLNNNREREDKGVLIRAKNVTRGGRVVSLWKPLLYNLPTQKSTVRRYADA